MISEFILATILTTVLAAVSIALNKQINETAKMQNYINNELEPPLV